MRLNFSGTRTRDGVYVILAAALTLFYVAAAGGGFPLDDSWIHQTYARNLAQTGQWAFLPGEPSAASTSPLYTVLLAVGYVLRVDYVIWTHLLGALMLALTAALGSRLAEILLPGNQLIGWLAGLALVFTWHLIWAAASGMETMLFSMFTLLMVWLVFNNYAALGSSWGVLGRRGGFFGVMAALATLTRPEGVLLSGLAGAVLVALAPRQRWRAVGVWCVGAGIGFVIVMSPYLALNLQLTGGLLPNTAAAKQAEYALLLQYSYPKRVVDLVVPIFAGGQILLLPGIGYFLWAMWRRRTFLALALPLWMLALVALYAARLPTPYQHGRYVIPALPALVVMGVVGMAGLVQAGRWSVMGRVLTRTLALSSAASFVFFTFVLGLNAYRGDVAIIDEEMVTTARWVADNLPPEDLLASHDIGALGYFAPRPIVDLAGLVTPEVVPIITNPDALWALMQNRGVRYLMGFPYHVPGEDESDPRLCRVFVTEGQAARSVNAPNMRVYALAWDGRCRD